MLPSGSGAEGARKKCENQEWPSDEVSHSHVYLVPFHSAPCAHRRTGEQAELQKVGCKRQAQASKPFAQVFLELSDFERMGKLLMGLLA